MGCGLVFDGDIDLMDASAGDSFGFEALAGVRFGQPVPVEAVIASLLRDGSIITTTRFDNREAAFPVRVRAADSGALADAEQRLALACGRPTTLAYTPADGYGPTTVFKVLTSYLEQPDATYDDLGELRNQRTYLLRLVCEPFTRSVDKITDSAGSPPSTGGTIVNACESTSGWSSAYGAAAPVVDSTLFADGTGSIKTATSSDRYIQSFTMSGTKYTIGSGMDSLAGVSIVVAAGLWLSIKIRLDYPEGLAGAGEPGDWSTVSQIQQYVSGGPVNGAQVSGVVASTVDSKGFVTYAWRNTSGASVTVTRLDFYWQQTRLGWGQPSPFVHYDSLTVSAAASTDQQVVRTLNVKGSARSTGSLHVTSPSTTTALGQVLVATMATSAIQPGFRPDTRRFVTSGTTTADTSALGGSYFNAVGGGYGTVNSPVFEVPASSLRAGPYSVVALVKSPSSLTLGVEAQLKVGATAVGPTSEAETTVPNGGALVNTWRIVSIGTVYLPPVPVQNPSSTTVVRLRFRGTVQLAEVFVIPQAADFSIIDCGTGSVSAAGASSHLWLDSPDLGQPQGGWWRGPLDARVDARSAWSDVKKPAQHSFEPGDLTAFLVSTGAQGPTLALEYFPHWQNHAGL